MPARVPCTVLLMAIGSKWWYCTVSASCHKCNFPGVEAPLGTGTRKFPLTVAGSKIFQQFRSKIHSRPTGAGFFLVRVPPLCYNHARRIRLVKTKNRSMYRDFYVHSGYVTAVSACKPAAALFRCRHLYLAL